ncbi:excinuclease ABC subunit UvrA [Nicoliella lavandulae]|uniref:UvrABC system protein A n=1 Tax=Nicoliella lavandulae TaxID=3082954 RepID=A0ABU8SKM0_9LACO
MSLLNHESIPHQIEVRGAKVNNLKNINVDIQLNAFTAITGVSGSGKSSLAMGVLYAEGARRYLNALSTYTRRRISQVGKADVTEVKSLPSAIALRQRPTVPNGRSTVGTMSEAMNVIRLMFSRLGSHVCPNGHRLAPTIKVSQVMDLVGSDEMGKLTCPTCGVKFKVPSAEDYAFNSAGACPKCEGTGVVRSIVSDQLVPDPNKTILDGAVASWRLPGRNFMQWVAQAAGVRIDVPFKSLSEREREIVFHGPVKTYAINIPTKTGKGFHMDNAKYENAYAAVEDSLKTTKNEKAIQRLNRFYEFQTCPYCHGQRFNPKLLTTLLVDKNIAQVANLTIDELMKFMQSIKAWLPNDMDTLANNLIGELKDTLTPLIEMGLDYLTLARAGNTLSTGELQRIQLGRTLRSQTTGVLYVLDEPSIGLHAANVTGLIKIFRRLISQGNTLVVVDHNTRVIEAADYVVEIGPEAGRNGGTVVDHGTVAEVKHDKHSLIAPFLNGTAKDIVRKQASADTMFDFGTLEIDIAHRNNLKHVDVKIPKQRMSVISGFSGAGKSTLAFDGIVTAMNKQKQHQALPSYITKFNNAGLTNLVQIDSTPIGKNVRSTVATYSGILDIIRPIFAKTDYAKQHHWNAGRFSYNVKSGACPNCDGTGVISLDIQYLPDMTMQCPVCHGKRYSDETLKAKWNGYSIADVLQLSVEQALPVFKTVPKVASILNALIEMGLGYLILGESTPILSGGEAQRLKLVTQMGQDQSDTLFIFDEPSVGLHPKDVQVLNHVFSRLIDNGATVLVIEHDLDVIMNADYVIDLGPKGGLLGGKVVATGTPQAVADNPNSITGKYLKQHLELFD